MKSKNVTEMASSRIVEVGSSSVVQTKSKAKINFSRKAESEFFVDNSALAGFTGERILYMAIRELIENSLDSCEAERILPKIAVSLKLIDPVNDLWSISCEDNGIGIRSDKVSVAVCSFLTSGKYVEQQQRGLFGVGLKMIAAFSTKDTDHPLRVWSKSAEETSEYYFELRTDIGTNKPIVLTRRDTTPKDSVFRGRSGFRIEAVLRGRLSPVTKNKIYDYISQTSIVNPYAAISFSTDDGKISFDRRTNIMPEPAKEVLPHPADMDLKTLKKAIANHALQKTTIQGILCNSFQKLSSDKAKEITRNAGIEVKQADKYSEHELIKIVNICRQTKFQSPNVDHLSPIGERIFTVGMTTERAIFTRKENSISDDHLQSRISTKEMKPTLTGYSSRACIINNRPTIVECGLAYGGNLSYFKLYRFANKIPLLYDEGSDVAREVISEVELNKMGVSKKQVKEQFSGLDSRSDRAIDLLPIHIFFHICSTKIPYKTAGKESIASEGELKKYMKACLSDLYRKVSKQIRHEMHLKDAENRLKLYKYYIPLIVNAISESIDVSAEDLTTSFLTLVERHLKKEVSNPRSLNAKTENHTLLEQHRNVRRLQKNSRF
ncbi:MAG TPA: DNA topoisomerase VI subunit B, partial [Nitrososphaeraceae archaeon]|nr:DNA topoisomerase VI subunit B [Nitrososphaeraceae archaeon]